MALTLESRDEQQAKEDGPDGFSATTIFRSPTGCQGLTYDDVILMPGECYHAVQAAGKWALCPSSIRLLIIDRRFVYHCLSFGTAS